MKQVKLTKKEIELILDFIEMELDSYRIGGNKNKKKKVDFDGVFSDDMYDKDTMKTLYEKCSLPKQSEGDKKDG